MSKKTYDLTDKAIRRYALHLREQERAPATVQKYVQDLTALWDWLAGRPLTKAALIEWKESLSASRAPATVNSMLAAVNGFFRFMRFITVEAVTTGRAEICNKGKRRTVFLPGRLRRLLRKYLQKQKKTAGAVFTTRTGRPLDRSNIWRDMKALCESADVEPSKVFPHNLRHLFARTYYSLEKDLSRLADILGHSSVNTTRIYTVESGGVHQRQLERMELIIT